MATEATKAIEAILMVAQEPVDPHLLAQLLEVAPDRVAELCDELQESYERDDRGFVLVKVAGGYRFQSHADMAPYVERFVLEGQTARLSSAALETLAIVAYKQPISRAQVAAIRGVNVDGVMRTLQQRGYIDEVGRDPGPGQATLFGTTREFLERLGLDSLDDLPAIADLFPDADVLEALEKGLRAGPAPEADRSRPVDEAPDASGVDDDDGEPEAADQVGDHGPDHGDGAAGPAPGEDRTAGVDGSPAPEPSTSSSSEAAPSEPELPEWFKQLEDEGGGSPEPAPPSAGGRDPGEGQAPDGPA